MIGGIGGVGDYGRARQLWGISPLDRDVQMNIDDPIAKSSKSSECQTCKNRKYVDGSDEMVSFKTPARISASASASRVRSHEQEHVNNAFAKASQKGGKVLQASVSMKMAICPECGRAYMAGGQTTTRIAYPKDNPYSDNKKSADRDALVGANVDLAV